MTLSIAARLALSDLVHLYAAAVDDRRFDEVAELFSDTAELRLPDPPRSLEPTRRLHGRDGVRTAMKALGDMARTEHAIVGEVYAEGPTADYALGRITCIAHHWSVADGQSSDLVWHLRYDDEYLLGRSGWRIHGRALTINAIETRPARRVRGHLPRTPSGRERPSAGRAVAADPSTASTAPQPRETSRRDPAPGTP